MADLNDDLISAIAAAQSGDWTAAHNLAQQHEGARNADWLHAILHKIEPDPANARYWYAKCGRNYDAFPDATAELDALRQTVEASRT